MLNMKKNSSASKLEVENRRMEDRLRVLKEMMSAEKARREQDGGIYWQSGKSGPLKNRHPPNSTPSKQTQNRRPVKVKVLSEKNDLSEQKSLPHCGQCERSSASLSCVECIENYCQVCFTRVHQKGALSRHHVKPILANIRRIAQRTVPNDAEVTEEPLSKPAPPVRPTGGDTTKPSLLEGEYDEDGAAKSFQLALAEWRSGNSDSSNHTSKALSTHTAKDSSTGAKFEASTMTGTVNHQDTRKELSIAFSDVNKVSYYERMLMRKYQDGSMERESTQRPNGITEHGAPSEEATEEEEGEADEPFSSGISQYNVFYDIDIMPAEEVPAEDDNEGMKCEAIPSSEDFEDCKPPLRASIEQVSFKDLCLTDETPSEKVSKQPPVEEPKQQSDSRQSSASKERRGKQQASVSEQTQKPMVRRKSEKGTKKKKAGGTENGIQAVDSPVLSATAHSDLESSSPQQQQQQHKLPDLTESVRAAWKICSQSNHVPQPLSSFFLQGVSSVVEEEVEPPQPGDGGGKDDNASAMAEASGGGDEAIASTFKLGSTVWLPHSSTVLQTETQSDNPLSEYNTDSPSDAVVPPPSSSSRPGTSSQRRDRYYDDTDSDSEPENEREEFISSRLGMTREEFISSRLGMARDSMEWSARAATPAAMPHPDLEGEEEGEKVERDRADCEALEELAWELASTVECEGRLTRNEGDLEQSDHLQGGMELDCEEGEAGSTTPVGAEGGGTDWMSVGGVDGGGDPMELEMSKVMSDFELYQRDLMEADSD